MSGKRKADGIRYDREITKLVAQLRQRDTDATYADAPVIDIYARVSRVVDALDNEKVPRQIMECLRNLLDRHAKLGEILFDENRSAWKRNGKRPDFEKLLARVEAGHNDGVLVWHVDRLARQPWDVERLIWLVMSRKRKARDRYVIASCYGDHRLSNLSELRMKMLFAAEESAAKSRRLCELNAKRRENGIVKGGAPAFGHRKDWESGPDDVQLRRERAALAWAIPHVVALGSLGSVAKRWNDDGVVQRSGKPWNPLAVRQTLLNPRHGGLIEFEGEVVRSYADSSIAIVDASTYLAMRAVFAGRARGRAHGEVPEHWLTAIVRCDRCGSGMMAQRVHNRRYPDGKMVRQYRCPPRGCNRNAVDARAAETYATLKTFEALADPRRAQMVASKSAALAKTDVEIGQLDAAIASLMAKARARIDRFDFYQSQADVLEDRREALVKTRRGLAEDTPASHALSVEELRQKWITVMSFDDRRALVASVLSSGIFCAPVGRGAYVRGDAILTRFDLVQGDASKRFMS